MNRGLLLRAWRESWPVTLLFGLLLIGFEAAHSFVLGKYASQVADQLLQLDIIRGALQAMLASPIGERMGPHLFHSIAWVHPLVLALTWAHALVSCTRVPAGEVDRGTVDVLLSLPVSRWELFLSESAIWLMNGAVVLAGALLGNLLGGMGVPAEQRPQLARLWMVLANLFSLYLAVGGLAWLVSACSNRRGRASMLIFLVLLVAFLLNYLAQLWVPLEKIAFLSPLNYHRPADVLANGIWPWKDMTVLLLAGGAMWAAAGVVFSRRDLCTV